MSIIILTILIYFTVYIIYHDFLPPPRRGSHVKPDNTHTHTIINIHPLARILDICALIFSIVEPSLQLIPTASCNCIRPLSRWWPPEHGRVTRKNTGPSKNGRVKLIQLHMYYGLSTLSDLLGIDAQKPPSFLCCPRPPSSHHPSSLTSVPIVPVLHWLPPSTPSGHTLLIHSFHMPLPSHAILSDLLYSLTPFLYTAHRMYTVYMHCTYCVI